MTYKPATIYYSGGLAEYTVVVLNSDHQILFEKYRQLGKGLAEALNRIETDAKLIADQERDMKRKDEVINWLTKNSGEIRVMGSDERGWAVMDCRDGLTFASRGHSTEQQAIDAAMLNWKEKL